jgi:hypothetical protein
VWAGGKLIIGGELTGIEKVNGKNVKRFDYRFYDGTQTAPDPRMEAVLGVGNCPSYEGTAYIIFYDFDLTEYGNSLAGCPIKVEFFVPDQDQEQQQNDIENYSVENVEQFLFPANIDDRYGCSMAMYSSRRYSVYSAEDIDKKYYQRFGTIGVIGQLDIVSPYNAETVFIHTRSDQINWILWGIQVTQTSPTVGTVLYTNIGNFTNPFPVSFPPEFVFCNLYAVLSIEGTNYALYKVNAAVPVDFGLAVNTVFLTHLGDSDILLVLGDLEGFTSINFTISQGNFYLFTGLYDSLAVTTEWVFNTYNILNGVLLSSEVIDVPATIGNDASRMIPKAAEIYNGKFYCGGASAGTFNSLFVIVIDLSTHDCTANRFDTLANELTQGDIGQFSVYNGIIGVSFYYSTPGRSGGRIYTLAPPVIDYSNPELSRIPIDEIVANELNAVGIPASEYDLTQIEADTTIGYRVTEISSCRSALGPIQSAYLFDFIEQDYKLKAVKRGGESIEIIPFTKLILEGDAVVKSETSSRVLMPSRLTINYIDYAREFDVGSQPAEYPAPFESVEAKDLPVVMQADEAAKLADIFIRSSWVESKKYQITLPYIYYQLRVSNVITVEVYPGKFVKMRIDQRTMDVSGNIQLGCSATSELTYESDASGDSGETGSEVIIPTYADPIPIVLDIPLIAEDQDIFGVAATVIQEPPTTQSMLMVSANNGITYTAIGRFNGPGVVGQSSVDVLGPGDPYVVEYGTDLILDNMISGEFFSVTYEEMLRNNNLIAYGQPGRWEILTYQDATPTGIDGGITLSTFIRGKYGTEQYMDGHTIGDLVVLLDHPNTIFAPLPAQAFGLSWPIKAVNVGDDVDGGVLANYGSYQAVNLKQLSVVNPDVWRAGLDWIIDFDPRTRYPSNQWIVGGLERTDTQYFSIDIFNGPAIVRTIQSETEPITYTEAQQIADFGSAQTTITIDIYQVSQRVGRGYPLRVTA